jgi:HK97 family phage portal protein
MAIILTPKGLTSTLPGYAMSTISGGWGGLRLGTEGRFLDYAAIYRTQPNVRTMVDFIARNIAQLGLHVYRRVGETDRQRLRTHPLAEILGRPNGWTTKHRFIFSVMADKGVFGNAFWLKYQPSRVEPMSLIRIPPQLVDVSGGLKPESYTINVHPQPIKDIAPTNIIHFRNYNPRNPIIGLSPLDSLQGILDEDLAAVEHRTDTWANAGRQPMIIKRPRSAGPWSEDVAARFNEGFTAALRSPRAQRTPILEDDMDLQLLSFTAEQSQYAEGRRLTMEQVAIAYHIPLSMVGIGGQSATFASVREFHKMLYQDTLGPWIDELESELTLQLMADFDDVRNVYLEFNILEKLQGSFEEQADLLGKAIGGRG